VNTVSGILLIVGLGCLAGMVFDQREEAARIQELNEYRRDQAAAIPQLERLLSDTGSDLADMKRYLDDIDETENRLAAGEARLAEMETVFGEQIAARRAEAMALVAGVIVEMRLAESAAAQHFIERRLARRDTDNAVVLHSMEARYGPALLALGIDEGRYEQILLELTRLRIESDDNLAAYSAGLLSDDEMRAMQAQNNLETAVESLLSEEEYSQFQASDRQDNERAEENRIYAQMLQLTPTMRMSSREMVAATYNRARQASPPASYRPDLSGAAERTRRYSYMVDKVLPSLAAMYRESLEGKELEEAMRFVRSTEISNLRNLRLIDEGIASE